MIPWSPTPDADAVTLTLAAADAHAVTTADAPPPPGPRTAMASVRVYNTSRIKGLAHHVAAEIRSQGWTVAAVGNVDSHPIATTLYYSPGAHAAARHLARQFSGIRRLAPEQLGRLHFVTA